MVPTNALRRALCLTLGVASLLTPLLLAAPAGAATGTTTPPVSEAITGYNYGGIWAGNYRLDDGAFPVYCITAHAGYPSGTYTAAQGFPSSVDAARVAYVIEHYGTSTGSNISAAVAALVGRYFDTVDTTEKWDVLSAGQIADANQIWADAAANAGPYTVHVTLPAGVDQGQSATGTVSVTANSGALVAGITLDLTSATATLATSSITTNASNPTSFQYTVPLTDSAGTYSIRAVGSAISGVVTYAPTGGGAPRQTVMGTADPTTIADNPTTTYVPARQVDLVKYRSPGTSTTPVPGATYELESSTGAQISSVVTSSSPVSLGELGVGTSYQLVESSAPAGYYIASSSPITFTVTAGSSPQLVVAQDPATPSLSITTSVATPTLTLGSTATDNVVLSGDDGEPSTLTGHLYGPLPIPSSGCSSIPSSQWSSAPLYSAVSSTTASVSTPVAKFGCFSWADSVIVTPSQATAQSPVGAPSETFTVPGPSLSTSVQSSDVLVGGSVADNANVTLPAGSSATLTGSLYGPLSANANSCKDLNWTGAPVAGSITPQTVTASGKVTTSSVTLSALGCYSFAETLTLPNGQSVSTSPGVVGEVVLVSSVPVTTIPTTTIPTTTHPHTTVPQVISGGGGPPGPWNHYLLFGLLALCLSAIGLAASSKRFSRSHS